MNQFQEPAHTARAGGQKETSTQTECNARGLSPRLSKVNLFTLLSLWMELFPNNEQKTIQRRRNGLVVVHSSKIIGLHCSSTELHAGQIAVVKHGSRMKDCDLYFSRKPCSTCLKMVLNAGVNRISYWPGDPEISLAEDKSNCDGTGARYFIGCGYNAYPMGSEYADYPQMDEKQQKDREARKFRYIVHAEQNALTFRCQDIKVDEKTMIFVTKCPCDECVPLINNAGIKQIYTGDLDAGKVKADISYQKFSGLQGVRKFTWQKAPTNNSLTSTKRAVHRKRGQNKSSTLQSTPSTGIMNTASMCAMGSSPESVPSVESSALGCMANVEDPQSPLAKGDLKRPLKTPKPESQSEELLTLEINEPAFKRRVVEQPFDLQSLVTSMHTVMNDMVDKMKMTVSRLNTSFSDIQNVLDQQLAVLQSSREGASSQTVSVVESSFTQGLSNIGASLQNSLTAAVSDVGCKVQESLQVGFENLGEKIQSTMREGFASLITEHASSRRNICNRNEDASPTEELNNSSQEVRIHNVSQPLLLHHPSQLSPGSSLESRTPSVVTQIPGGTKI
ncbi:cytidine and dCMP deaminase domain-containing protein 1 isoform X2 [Mustelus asterias]